MKHDATHVLTGVVTVVWDGITMPNIDEKTNQIVDWNLRVAMPDGCPEHHELHALAMDALKNSAFKGTLPPGGNWPFMDADVAKLGPLVAGHKVFSAKTRNGVPFVSDTNGAEVSPMAFKRSFYPGAKVKLLVHAYAYDNKQKGVAFGLDGVMIVDTSAPQLDVAAGMSKSDVAAALMGNGTAPTPTSPPSPGQPATGAPASLPSPGGTVVSAPSMPTPVTPNPAIRDVPQPGALPTPPAPPAAAHTMTAAANGHSYETLIGAGWTDATLKAAGMML